MEDRTRWHGPETPRPRGRNLRDQEHEIVWLEDASAYPSVYEGWATVPHRAAAPTLDRPGRLLGYAILRPHSHPRSPIPGNFLRRVWYVCDPAEHTGIVRAVDPRSIVAGQPSQALRTIPTAVDE